MLSRFEELEMEEIVKLLQAADDCLPLLDAAVEAGGKVGQRVKPLLEAIGDWQIERRVHEYQRYLDAGMTSAQAVSLLCAVVDSLASALGAAGRQCFA